MQKRGQRYFFLIMLPAFALLTLFIYYPIFQGAVIAFQRYTPF